MRSSLIRAALPAFAADFAIYLKYLPCDKRGSVFAIESANIVGYTTKEAPKGKFIIMGAQFEGVKGGTNINDLIGGVEGVEYGDGISFEKLAPQIQIPVAGGYDIYYYLTDGYDLEKNDGTVAPGWCDGVGNLVNAEVTPGVAIWMKSVNADANANVSGAVASDDVAIIECPEGFALRANVFPISIKLNSLSMTSDNIIGSEYGDGISFEKTAPQIQIPVAGGYDIYYYLTDGYDLEKNDGTVAPGWCDGVGNLVTDVTIPAAQGFWTKGVSGKFTLKFTK